VWLVCQPGVLPRGGAVCVPSVHIPLRSSSYGAATDKTDGGTASRSDVENTSLYLGNGPNCYCLPLLVARFRRLGKIFICLLMDMACWDTQKPNKILTCSPALCCRCASQDLDPLARTQCGCGAGCGTDLRARVHQFLIATAYAAQSGG
jgi:hypothetical protein